MVGTGERAEKIRTYNYPQNRVTDHRLRLTLHKLDAIIEGDLEELLTALRNHHQASLAGRQSAALTGCGSIQRGRPIPQTFSGLCTTGELDADRSPT